jgi:hypothetical protein
MIVREPRARAGVVVSAKQRVQPNWSERHPVKRENLVILLGDSIIDNGEYVGSGEPDVAHQLQTLLPHHTVVKRAVDGAKSADVLASQIAEVERAEHIILSAGGKCFGAY